MKKILLVLMLSLLLTSCSEQKNDRIDDLSGKYEFNECVYLTPFSSATKEYFTAQHAGVVYILINETTIEYNDTEQSLFTYDDLDYREVPFIDHFTQIFTDEFNDIFEQRYDIYSDDTYTGLTLFFNEENIYLAEIRILGTNSEEYHVWTVFTLTKSL